MQKRCTPACCIFSPTSPAPHVLTHCAQHVVATLGLLNPDFAPWTFPIVFLSHQLSSEALILELFRSLFRERMCSTAQTLMERLALAFHAAGAFAERTTPAKPVNITCVCIRTVPADTPFAVGSGTTNHVRGGNSSLVKLFSF